MSTQVTTAFVQQFSANISMLSQQMGSLLRSSVDVESVNGEKAFLIRWDRQRLYCAQADTLTPRLLILIADAWSR